MTSPVPRAAQEALVRDASRAPSVHNVQPARWRFRPSGEVLLYRDLRRELPAADPEGADVLVSLGAAWEGMALAGSRRGLRLGEPERPASEPAELAVAGHRLVARAAFDDGGSEDPLARWVSSRRAFRGKFAAATVEHVRSLEALCAASGDLRVVTVREEIRRLAERYDRASVGFLAMPEYSEELYRWLRFSPRHSGWSRDGLNADCMAMSGVERRAASILLRPSVFRVLARLGLARAVVSEAPQIESGAGVLLFCPLAGDNPFARGRRFHRLWLEITALGLCLCPLSALVDDRDASSELAGMLRLPVDRRIAGAFRVGPPPHDGIAESPRLPVGEVLFPEGGA